MAIWKSIRADWLRLYYSKAPIPLPENTRIMVGGHILSLSDWYTLLDDLEDEHHIYHLTLNNGTKTLVLVIDAESPAN